MGFTLVSVRCEGDPIPATRPMSQSSYPLGGRSKQITTPIATHAHKDQESERIVGTARGRTGLNWEKCADDACKMHDAFLSLPFPQRHETSDAMNVARPRTSDDQRTPFAASATQILTRSHGRERSLVPGNRVTLLYSLSFSGEFLRQATRSMRQSIIPDPSHRLNAPATGSGPPCQGHPGLPAPFTRRRR